MPTPLLLRFPGQHARSLDKLTAITADFVAYAHANRFQPDPTRVPRRPTDLSVVNPLFEFDVTIDNDVQVDST
jgi:hypothetical protein